jgi:hypothetical protein
LCSESAIPIKTIRHRSRPDTRGSGFGITSSFVFVRRLYIGYSEIAIHSFSDFAITASYFFVYRLFDGQNVQPDRPSRRKSGNFGFDHLLFFEHGQEFVLQDRLPAHRLLEVLDRHLEPSLCVRPHLGEVDQVGQEHTHLSAECLGVRPREQEVVAAAAGALDVPGVSFLCDVAFHSVVFSELQKENAGRGSFSFRPASYFRPIPR